MTSVPTFRFIAITGSRPPVDPTPHQLAAYRAMLADVEAFVAGLGKSDVLVHGAAQGVDRIAGDAAKKRGLLTCELPVGTELWSKHGKPIYYLRDAAIAQIASEAVAFWFNGSRGTKNTIELFQALGKPVDVREVKA
jgi:hypothetical protein